MLEEIRLNDISPRTWTKLQQRNSEFSAHTSPSTLLNTTHIVGFKEIAQQINTALCNLLPVPEQIPDLSIQGCCKFGTMGSFFLE